MIDYNSLRALQSILSSAIKDGDPQEIAGIVLLDTMNLGREPNNFMIFHELLSRAEDDSLSLINMNGGIYKDEYTESIQAIKDLQSFFISNYPMGQYWDFFVNELNRGRYTSILASLARDYHNKNPKIFLERFFGKS
jgi:hypothetical protein